MLLELDHISKIYGDLRAVDDLNLTVPEGEWLAIVGSSGSGKTTLMNMIGCMDTPSKGSVMLEGRKLEDLNAKQLADVRKNMIGLVFQKFYLVPHLTAVENVMVAQYYHSVVNEQQALEALERVGLKERAHHLPGQLSGGEQQRIVIARAVLNSPAIILADEPTGNLDTATEQEIIRIFRRPCFARAKLIAKRPFTVFRRGSCSMIILRREPAKRRFPPRFYGFRSPCLSETAFGRNESLFGENGWSEY